MKGFSSPSMAKIGGEFWQAWGGWVADDDTDTPAISLFPCLESIYALVDGGMGFSITYWPVLPGIGTGAEPAQFWS